MNRRRARILNNHHFAQFGEYLYNDDGTPLLKEEKSDAKKNKSVAKKKKKKGLFGKKKD